MQHVKEHRSDDELVQRICDRDQTALDAVIGLYGGQVNELCKRICGNDVEASEVVSIVFSDLWSNASNFRSHHGSLRGYLLRMARIRSVDRYRCVTNHQRRQNRNMEPAAIGKSEFINVDSAVLFPIDAGDSRRIGRALDQLPVLQRQTLILAFFHGLSLREVAEKMDLPLDNVTVHIRTGLLKLKTSLAIDEPELYSEAARK